MRDCPQHRFYTLTKQPQNLPQWEFPDNCWVGVTATNRQKWFDAIWELLDVQASVKFISFEPLLDWTYLAKETGNHQQFTADWFRKSGINWVIIGACTGTKPDMEALIKRYPQLTLMPWGKKWTAQPPILWVDEIVEAADRAGVKVFLKNNLKPLLKVGGWEIGEHKWITELRQEMPIGEK